MSSSCPKSSWVLSLCRCPHSYPGRRAHMCCLLVLLLLMHVCGCLWLPPFLRSCCALFVCLPSMSTASRLWSIFFSFFLFFLQLCPLPCVLCVLCVILRPVFKFNCCGNCTHEPLSQSERLRLRHGVGLGLGTDIGFARVDCGRDRLDFQSKCSAREQLHSRHAPVSYVPSPLYWAFLILVNKILSNF